MKRQGDRQTVRQTKPYSSIVKNTDRLTRSNREGKNKYDGINIRFITREREQEIKERERK